MYYYINQISYTTHTFNDQCRMPVINPQNSRHDKHVDKHEGIIHFAGCLKEKRRLQKRPLLLS